MMDVKLLFFAEIREDFGSTELTMQLRSGTTVDQLLEKLRLENEKFAARPAGTFSVSINREYSSTSEELTDGCEVGLLPPVGGGDGGTID